MHACSRTTTTQKVIIPLEVDAGYSFEKEAPSWVKFCIGDEVRLKMKDGYKETLYKVCVCVLCVCVCVCVWRVALSCNSPTLA
jgi:hypothetical protein